MNPTPTDKSRSIAAIHLLNNRTSNPINQQQRVKIYVHKLEFLTKMEQLIIVCCRLDEHNQVISTLLLGFEHRRLRFEAEREREREAARRERVRERERETSEAKDKLMVFGESGDWPERRGGVANRPDRKSVV